MNELFTQTHIKAMLEEYHELNTTEKALMDNALSSTHLYGNHLLYISMVHNFGLTPKQTAQLLDMPLKNIVYTLNETYETLEAVLNGYRTNYKTLRNVPANEFDMLLQYLILGKYHPFNLPSEYFLDMLYYRATKLDDHAAKVALGQEKGVNEPLTHKPLKYYEEAPAGMKKTKGNDGFYNQDQLNGVVLRGSEYHE